MYHLDEADKNLVPRKRISNDADIRFLRPFVNKPQTEESLSAYACVAGAAMRSSASGARCG